MAETTTVVLVDDLDGTAADETVDFALDGVLYTIDLSEANAERIRDVLTKYVGAARRTGGRFKRGMATRGDTRPAANAGRSPEQNQAIREWARKNGHPVAERGRIPADVIAAFEASGGTSGPRRGTRR